MDRNWAVAPGEYLEEWAQDRGVTQAEVAGRLGVSRKHVNEIVNGRAAVSPDLAARLELVTGIPADAWLRYQAQWQADRARLAAQESLGGFGEGLSPKVGKYLRSIGATTATRRDPGRLAWDFLRHVRCASEAAYLDACERLLGGGMGALALKESPVELDRDLLMAWFGTGDEALERFPVEAGPYSEGALRAVLPAVRERARVTDAATLSDIRRLLAGAGVRLLFVDFPEGLPLYGVTRWVDGAPVIALTGRRRKDGFIVWTLFHELGHVLLDGDASVVLEGEGVGGARGRREREKAANDFARRCLFGERGEVAFKDVRSRGELARVAEEVGVCPGVAVHSMHRMRWVGHGVFADQLVDMVIPE